MDYDTIINALYHIINKITAYTVSDSYTFKTKKYDFTNEKNILDIINTGGNLNDTEFILFIRELVIVLLKKLTHSHEIAFNIIILDNITKIKLFVIYCVLYHYDSHSYSISNNKNSYIGIDFEFNTAKIALCQIAFFTKRTSKFIFIFNPTELDNVQTELFIKYTLISKFIIKLVHGSDSLDIPYIFQELFANNYNYIYDFVKNIIDMRFICEYIKIITMSENKKCNIYDALLYFSVIDTAKYDYLMNCHKSINENKNNEQLWNVHNMNNEKIIYTLYDVIYLLSFYKQLRKYAKKTNRQLYITFNYIILFTRLIFLDKWNIIDLSQIIKKNTDPLNNYIVHYNKNNTTMINIFNSIIEKLFINLNGVNIYLKYFLGINYFKSTIVLIMKQLIYYILATNYNVFMNKNDLFTGDINYKFILNILNDNKFNKLSKFIKLFYKQSYIYITKHY